MPLMLWRYKFLTNVAFSKFASSSYYLTARGQKLDDEVSDVGSEISQGAGIKCIAGRLELTAVYLLLRTSGTCQVATASAITRGLAELSAVDTA